MKSKGKAGPAARRARREFSDEFKAEAVRLAADRRAAGGSLTQVGRELDVRPPTSCANGPDSRRAPTGSAPTCRARPSSRRIAGCAVRSRCCARSRPSQKKWRRI